MAGPITWRSVVGPSLAQAAAPMQYAGQNFNAGIEAFQNALTAQQQANQGQVDRAEDAALTGYRSLLQSLNTPEALAAAQADGRIANAFNALSAANQAKALGQDEQRLATVRDLTRQGVEFGNFQTAEAARPAIDAANAAIAARDPNAAQLVEQVPVQFRANLLDAARQAERGDTEWTRKGTLFDLDTKSRQATIRNQNLQADTAADALATNRAEREALGTLTSTYLPAYQEKMEASRQKIAALAKEHNIPLNESGLPDESQITDVAKLSAFNTAAKPLFDEIASHADQAKRDFLTNMKSVSPARLTEFAAHADAILNPNLYRSAQTLEAAAARQAEIDRIASNAKANNLAYVEPGQENTEATRVLGLVDELIKDGPMTRTSLRNTIGKWMTEGFVFERGTKPIRVPPRVIERALRQGLESDTWIDNETDKHMANAIRQIMTSPEYIAMQEQADFLKAGGTAVDKARVQSNVIGQTGTQTPAENAQALRDIYRLGRRVY